MIGWLTRHGVQPYLRRYSSCATSTRWTNTRLACRAYSSGGSKGPDDEPKDTESKDPEEEQVEADKTAGVLVTSGHGPQLPRALHPEQYPQIIFLPITGRPLFPSLPKVVDIRDEAVCRAVVAHHKRGNPFIGTFLAKDLSKDTDTVKDISEIHRIGTVSHIESISLSDNFGSLILHPLQRIRAKSVIKEKPASIVDVDYLSDEPTPVNNQVIRALTQEIFATARDMATISPIHRQQINLFNVANIVNQSFNRRPDDSPGYIADFFAGIVSGDAQELQEVLESLVIEERLRKVLVLMKKEHVNLKLQQDIKREVEDKIMKKQREYYLGEQLKHIKKELGLEKDDRESIVTKFQERVKTLVMPEAVKKVFEDEINKLNLLDAASPEFNVTRNYLDWITLLPWGVRSVDNYDLKIAQGVLDEDHYGLKDVKERILEFIAVGKLKGTVLGKILCLVGPPGVGKTSVGKSIARSLGREFFRFSVGGLSDVAEIKGHRRTYIGSMPGKIVQCLKRCKTENPVVMIDEIDKVGRGGHQGDPTSALLELLDPEQNSSFLDYYLDVPIDLSKALFVCTANSTDTIPAPLLDRMEVIRLSGYVAEEKLAIAERYLIPQARTNTSLKEDQITMSPEALDDLIRLYCRESGVRNLQKQVDKVFRKAAYKILHDNPPLPISVTRENLHEFVGSPIFTSERLYEKNLPGVATGLAWTAMGGALFYIESRALVPAKPDSPGTFAFTGQLGDVMKESATIAYVYAKTYLQENFPDSDFLRHRSVHMHIPEGATPKDGPSAGCTIVTSLLSLALDRPIKENVAMTGEISLTGKILRIGGVREKCVAAKRAGITTLIMPASNRHDFEELPDYLRSGLTVHYVEHYREIFPLVFPSN